MAWTLAGSSLVLLVIATILNAIFAFSLHSSVPAIQLLAFMAFAVNILAISCLAFIISHYVPKVKSGSSQWSTAFFWRFLGMSASAAFLAALLVFATLVWATSRIVGLSKTDGRRPSRTNLIAWFVVWGVSVILQIAAYGFLAWWTKRVQYSRSFAAMDLDFGVGSPEMGQSPMQPRPTTGSFQSQDPTLTSPPQTPTAKSMSSHFRLSHSGGKGGPTSSRTRLVHSKSFVRDSAKSSFDYPTRAVSIDHPFDKWDTSGLARDVRSTLQSTPPATRSGLATIPGSRPESPAKALDGPFLPDSPFASSSEAATAVESSGPPSTPKASISSPPSSPPNFSRPTSRQINQPMVSSAFQQSDFEPPPDNLVHPLFRSTSPHPAPVATAGTIVTASPLAGQSITPKTLTRMRSASMPQQTSPLKESELPPQPELTLGPSEPGSPGPSIIDDDDSPPGIPDFILSAGQRSSYLGYGKRKSVKSRAASFHSQGDGLSARVL